MITSSNNAKVKQVVQWQTKAKERRKDHVFLAEGVRMCEEAPVKSVREVYLTEELEQKLRRNAQNGDTAFWDKLQQTGYETVSPEVFAKMADTQTPQGILTVLEQPSYDLTQLLEHPEPLFLILENLQDPGNLGTMIRTGEGAGITGVIMNQQTVDIFNPKTIRATMGSIFRVPFVYVPELSTVLTQMHERGIHTYAAHLKGQKVRRYQYLGLWIFVAIPLPGTGAWTGSLVAAFLNMRLKQALPAVVLGVMTAGCIMTALTHVGINLFA